MQLVIQQSHLSFTHRQGSSYGIQMHLCNWEESVDICDFMAVICLLSDEFPFSEAAPSQKYLHLS